MKSVSIVLCTCNGSRYLDAQLESLRVQQCVDEIVVVDDASDDDTLDLLQRHAAADPRVRVHVNSARLGVTRNFERAISLVRGEWVALSDQDDVWLPHKIKRMLARWDGVADLMHHDSRKFHGPVPTRQPRATGGRRKFSGADARRLLHRNSVVGHTVLVRTALARALLPFPFGVPHDWWLGVGAAVFGAVQYHDEALVHYRIHERNAHHARSSRWRRLVAEHGMRLQLLEAIERRGLGAGEFRAFARRYARLLQETSPQRVIRLAQFYRLHADVFHGGKHYRPGWLTRWRKTLAATLSALWVARATDASLALPAFAQVRPISPLEQGTTP